MSGTKHQWLHHSEACTSTTGEKQPPHKACPRHALQVLHSCSMHTNACEHHTRPPTCHARACTPAHPTIQSAQSPQTAPTTTTTGTPTTSIPTPTDPSTITVPTPAVNQVASTQSTAPSTTQLGRSRSQSSRDPDAARARGAAIVGAATTTAEALAVVTAEQKQSPDDATGEWTAEAPPHIGNAPVTVSASYYPVIPACGWMMMLRKLPEAAAIGKKLQPEGMTGGLIVHPSGDTQHHHRPPQHQDPPDHTTPQTHQEPPHHTASQTHQARFRHRFKEGGNCGKAVSNVPVKVRPPKSTAPAHESRAAPSISRNFRSGSEGQSQAATNKHLYFRWLNFQRINVNDLRAFCEAVHGSGSREMCAELNAQVFGISDGYIRCC